MAASSDPGRAGEQSWTAVLYEVPSNFEHIVNVALEVPESVSEAFGVRGHVPVVGTVDGEPLMATLVPTGGFRHRLFLNAEVRQAIGKQAGDSVRVAVRFDASDRTPPIPEELTAALAEAGLTQQWESLAPSHRKEWLTWLLDAKRDETRQRRVRRITEELVRC